MGERGGKEEGVEGKEEDVEGKDQCEEKEKKRIKRKSEEVDEMKRKN